MKAFPKTLRTLILLCAILSADQISARESSPATDISQLTTLEKKIEQLEMTQGDFSATLYQPLRELGLLQSASGDHVNALNTFRRMQNLVHRIHGVYDPRQFESVDFIIDTYYHHGTSLDLDRTQHFRFRVAEKSFTPESEQYKLARMKLADWYRISGQYYKASDLYGGLLESPDIDPAFRVRLLRSDAMTRYLAGRSGASESLQKALELIETEHTGIVEPSQALVDYIDMALIERDPVAVKRSDLAPAFLGFQKPRHVLALMARSEFNDPSVETYVNFGDRESGGPAVPTVGFPVAMCGNTYDSLVAGPGERQLEFNVSVVVDNEGRPADISVDGEGPLKLKRYLKDSLESGRFRPATTADGEFTTSTLSFRQTFAEVTEAPGSLSNVMDWSKMMVAKTCQISGVQRI